MLRRAAAQAAASLSRRACVQGAPCSVISSLSSTGSAQLAATACRRELGAASVSTFRGFCAGPSRPENEGPPGSTPSDAGRPSTSAKSETAVPVVCALLNHRHANFLGSSDLPQTRCSLPLLPPRRRVPFRMHDRHELRPRRRRCWRHHLSLVSGTYTSLWNGCQCVPVPTPPRRRQPRM